MSAYPPPEGSFTNGDVHNDSDGSWTFHDGGWYDNSLGEDNFLQGVEIPFGQIGSDNMGDAIPCVECHHTTGQDMQTSPVRNPRNILNVKEGVALWGEGGLSANNLMAENKRGKILFSLDLGEVSSRSSAGLKDGNKGFYEFLSGYNSRENDYKKGGRLLTDPKTDYYIPHKYKKYDIYQLPYTNKLEILGITNDTMLRRSQIKQFDKDRQFDSINLIPLLNNQK